MGSDHKIEKNKMAAICSVIVVVAVVLDQLVLPELQHFARSEAEITEAEDVISISLRSDGLPDLLHFDVSQGFALFRLALSGVEV